MDNALVMWPKMFDFLIGQLSVQQISVVCLWALCMCLFSLMPHQVCEIHAHCFIVLTVPPLSLCVLHKCFQQSQIGNNERAGVGVVVVIYFSQL